MFLLDWILCIGVVVALFGQGWWFARAQKTTEDYFVGGRHMNWLAVGLSLFATTFSPLSFVGFPREAAYGNYHLFLAILFIPLYVAPLVGWLFVPLFFLLGTTLFAFYYQHPAAGAVPGSIFPPLPKEDHLTTYFVRTELPYPGLLGLMLAGLFATVMGSISSGLNSLSALVIFDWLQGRSPGVRTSRAMSLLFGICAVGTALLVPHLGEHVFDIIIKIAGAFFGPLLGLFLLAALVRRANASGAALGLMAGMVSLALLFPTKISPWWYGAFTCLPTLIVGALTSLLFPPPAADQVRGLVVTWGNGDDTPS